MPIITSPINPLNTPSRVAVGHTSGVVRIGSVGDAFVRQEPGNRWPSASQVAVTGEGAAQTKGHERQALLEMGRQAHAQAAKAKILDDYGHRGKHFGAFVELENGVRCAASSVDLAYGQPMCDLRTATAQAVNESLRKGKTTGLVVKRIVLVNGDLQGARPHPCGECQSVMAGPHFSPGTLVASVYPVQDQESQKTGKPYELNIRHVRDMLPLLPKPGETHVAVRSLESLPIERSEAAERVMEEAGIGLTRLLEMLESAKSEYGQNAESDFSGKATGAAVLVTAPPEDGRASIQIVGTGRRLDLSSTHQWTPADLAALGDAFRRLQAIHGKDAVKQATVQAVAYYGDDAELPDIKSIGNIGRYRGGENTLVALVEGDAIRVRTLGDYMPAIYRAPQPKVSSGNTD